MVCYMKEAKTVSVVHHTTILVYHNISYIYLSVTLLVRNIQTTVSIWRVI